MKRSLFVGFAVLLLLAPGPSYGAKVYRIGSLNTADQFVASYEGFRTRMAELGYKEGQNVRYEFYNSKGSDEVLRNYAQKLVQDNVDLIVTSSTTATVAAAKATEKTNIPVVFLSAGNPQRIVKSFAGSGTNLAGISSATLEITGKRFELLRDLAPGVKRVAVPIAPKGVNYQSNVTAIRQEAKRLGFTIWEIEMQNREEIAKLSPAITRKAADAIFTPADTVITEAIEILVKQSIKEKLPVITTIVPNVEKGCLATYAADYFALGRQGAVIADKIFRGLKPSDLPIELPQKLKLVINMKTARAIGLKVPKEVLLRADEVID